MGVSNEDTTNNEERHFPLYLYGEDNKSVFSVIDYLDHGVSFVDGKGYIDPETSQIRIFSKVPRKHDKIPYFWYEHGLIEFNTVSEKIKEIFDAKNLKEYTVDTVIKNTTPGEQLYDERALSDMNDATSVYTPVIKEDDDFLKIIVKTIILAKGVNINRLNCKFDKKYKLSNLKAALEGKTKMSVVNFKEWTEILGVDFEIIITDDGTDRINPLYKPIRYISITNKAE